MYEAWNVIHGRPAGLQQTRHVHSNGNTCLCIRQDLPNSTPFMTDEAIHTRSFFLKSIRYVLKSFLALVHSFIFFSSINQRYTIKEVFHSCSYRYYCITKSNSTSRIDTIMYFFSRLCLFLGLVLPALAQVETGAAITVNKDTLEPTQEIMTATMRMAASASKTAVATMTDHPSTEKNKNKAETDMEEEEETKTKAKAGKATETNTEEGDKTAAESGTETGEATGTETEGTETETGTETGDASESTETDEDGEEDEEDEDEDEESETDSSTTEETPTTTHARDKTTSERVFEAPATDVPDLNDSAVSFHDPGFIALSFATALMMMVMMLV